MVDDPSQLRISDADRHKVAEVLRDAAGEGRLEMDELDERLEATYAAKTYADLVPITLDLPTRGIEPVRAASPVPTPNAAPPGTMVAEHKSSFAMMGAQERKGVWQVGARHTAVSIMAGVDIDLRQAIFTEPETVIYANAVMGAVDVVVNPFTHVIIDGVGIMGDFSQSRDRAEPVVGPNSPVVRVKGVALMGAVTVVRKAMPGEGRKRKRLRGGR